MDLMAIVFIYEFYVNVVNELMFCVRAKGIFISITTKE